ncbi:MAG: nucleotide sugar dehydrogenase [Burkholderiaceae bacterium]|nr:nucleotide sugar dehydrogenase [Burkholderiaceae bacterium]
MKVSIFGLGYVGSVSAACLARDGHDVLGVDLNPQKLALLRSGKAPIVEEGIQALTREAVESGRLQVTDDVTAAIGATELSFICVGTPSSANGSQDLSAVVRVSEAIGGALARKSAFHTVVLRSTVAPGTALELIKPALESASGKRSGVDFGLCFQPEFLREGSSIRDYDHPPFTLVGGDSPVSIEALRQLFGHLPCEFIATDIRTAEALKLVCNAFHALKITFANEVGRIAGALDIDSRQIMALVCRDTRLNISPAYMKPGFAFGGSCLPKDLRALMYLGRARDVDTPVLSSILPSNQIHIESVVERVLADKRRRIALLGLSFKPGTDDLRESPLVALAERLLGKGLRLSIYDADVSLSRLIGANKQYIEDAIPHLGELLAESAEATVKGADIVIVGHPLAAVWEAVYAHATSEQLVIDLAGNGDRARMPSNYWGVCW